MVRGYIFGLGLGSELKRFCDLLYLGKSIVSQAAWEINEIEMRWLCFETEYPFCPKHLERVICT